MVSILDLYPDELDTSIPAPMGWTPSQSVDLVGAYDQMPTVPWDQMNITSNEVMQATGAKPLDTGGLAQDILSSRFAPAGTGYGDYASGIVQSALGKPTLGTDVGQGRLQQQIKDLQTFSEMQKNIATADYYSKGGAAATSPIAVMGPDGNPVFVPRTQAMSGGYSPLPQAPIAVIDANGNPTFASKGDIAKNPSAYKPTAGYNTNNVTITPDVIDLMADSIAAGATPTSVGLGYGNNANKAAVMARVAEKYPGTNLADAQIDITGKKQGARTIAAAGGRIGLAGESLTSMIPLARQAASKIDSTQFPSINALQNAVAKGTGDPNIIALNTYLNAIQSDHAALMVRTGVSSDAARQKAYDMANSAMANGQLESYFNAVEQEKTAQDVAIKNALTRNKTGAPPTSSSLPTITSPSDPAFANLQPGQHFLDANGVERTKH